MFVERVPHGQQKVQAKQTKPNHATQDAEFRKKGKSATPCSRFVVTSGRYCSPHEVRQAVLIQLARDNLYRDADNKYKVRESALVKHAASIRATASTFAYPIYMIIVAGWRRLDLTQQNDAAESRQ